MPPWPAVAGYGQFANDNSLTLREKQFIVGWVEGLGPRNAGSVFLNVADPRTAKREEVRAVSHARHWQLGEPHLTRPVGANTIPAGQGDVVRKTVIDLGLTAPRALRAIEYLPGDRRVVRAAVFTLEQTGQWLGSWTPWYPFASLPEGVSHRLPAGSRVVAEIHYRSARESVTDAGALGLYLASRAHPAHRFGSHARCRSSSRVAHGCTDAAGDGARRGGYVRLGAAAGRPGRSEVDRALCARRRRQHGGPALREGSLAGLADAVHPRTAAPAAPRHAVGARRPRHGVGAGSCPRPDHAEPLLRGSGGFGQADQVGELAVGARDTGRQLPKP
jgi:hypothetical protein